MAKIKFVSLDERKFKNIFICKRCGSKIRADIQKIIGGKIKCRKCNARVFRPKSKTTKREKK